MGRIKPRFPIGNFTIRTAPNKKGEVSIYLVYNVDSITVAKTTGIKILPSDWDEKKQMVRAKNRDAARLTNLMKKLKDKVDAQIQTYDGGPITADVVKKILSGECENTSNAPSRIDFIEYAKSYNQQRYDVQKISYSTFYNADKYIDQFQRFVTETTGEAFISISKISVDIIEKYKAYRLKKGNTKEGINKMLTPLFKAIQYAKDNELISVQTATAITTSYMDLKDRRYKSEVEDAEIHYLDEKQLEQFISLYDQVTHDRTREIMDMFLFAFHACGLRVSDIITLEWKHVDLDKKELSKNLYKGNVLNHTIPLTEPAIEILKRWKRKKYNDRFVFNLLPSIFDLDDAASLDEKRKSKNRTLQMSLVAIGRKMTLPFNLTMHVARHTFAVLALNNNLSLHMISKLLGHSSVLTTEKVYAEFLPKTITEEVQSKLSFNKFAVGTK